MEDAAFLPGVPNSFQHLWTPHRLVYIKEGQQPADHECPFCLAPGMSDEQALIVHRGKTGFVLLNLFPYNSGHLLVCPYRHVSTYDQATPEEIAERALDKIIYVGSQAHPTIRDQAEAFRESIRQVLVYYLHEAVRSHNVTLVNKFHEMGYPELVKILDA